MKTSTTYATARLLVSLVLVTAIGYLTFFRGYESPRALYWDENYHIAAAQKYLNRIFFLEMHPPLGKMFIALGELILHPNPNPNEFIDTHFATKDALSSDFSFAGYRLFPALFGWLTAPLIFLTVITITNRFSLGILASGLFLFDNAFIVHSRGAMIDSSQIFFFVLALYSFFTLTRRTLTRSTAILMALLLGASIGAVVATKVNGMIAIVLMPLLWLARGTTWRRRLASMSLALFSTLLVYFSVWYLHFYLGTNRNSKLTDSGYFTQNPEVRSIIDQNRQATLSAFPVLWRENAIHFIARYSAGVPRLDLCKPTENGSPALLWPLGARSIRYRWEAAPGNEAKYLYLVANPVGWATVLLSVFAALALLFANTVFPSLHLKDRQALSILLLLYLGYLLGISWIDRVMYLYHYLFALVVGYILVPSVLNEIDSFGGFRLTAVRKKYASAVLVVGAFAAYLVYYPLTYYMPISDNGVRSRALLKLWDLTCAGCPRTSNLATPKAPALLTKRFSISELAPTDMHQDWGQPQLGVSVTGKPIEVQGKQYAEAFGMHSKARISYPTEGGYSRFTADVGLPDYLIGTTASVQFRVEGDGQLLWESSVIKAGDPVQHVDVKLTGVKLLTLLILDGNNGITDDHGFWGNMVLTPNATP